MESAPFDVFLFALLKVHLSLHASPSVILTLSHERQSARMSKMLYTPCPQKHVTTFSTITITISVRLQ